ncbi:hypothetical protein BD309DRAFT_878497 [Dichomitus squalens]|uniref:Uncharacterized protein n=1 Tax=Dichomitus squalens TaxID=114155 RepID=A0A4Q9PDZ5_9APHY|nr:hypothetical protein BD309DRAFT_878497 [Dichomitus squalens]TBU52315.1 hypothetical protein BD310DRAFT_952771 [Dichomitus squalens]
MDCSWLTSTYGSARPHDYRANQDGKVPILDGRYGGSGPLPVTPPVEVFHPAFASFVNDVANDKLLVPDDVVTTTASFMQSLSEIATLEAERTNTRGMLKDLLDRVVIQTVNKNKSSADHIVVLNRREAPFEQAVLAIVEEKGELGSGSDPSVQGSFSYIEHWISTERKAIRQVCFCPSFIISIAGPWVNVCGAVFTTLPIVHRLTDYIWLGRSRTIDDGHILRVARVFYALRRALQALETYYEELPFSPDDATGRFFPLATSCILEGGEKLEFTYELPLKGDDPSCVAFLVADKSDRGHKLVVKFVERYGKEAHELLAQHGRAPTLLYCGDVWSTVPGLAGRTGYGPWKMVVMDYVKGRTAADLDEVPDGVRDAVRSALVILHERGMVHGDIRLPNIIIEDDRNGDEDEEDMGKRTRIVDFDWAGKEGEVRYPHDLSERQWVEGVEDYVLIRACHDDAMVDRLR